MANDSYAELESILHLLTPDELRAAELLLTPSERDLFASLPDAALFALGAAADALLAARGIDPDGKDTFGVKLNSDEVLPLVPDEQLRERLRCALVAGYWEATP